MTFFEFLTGVGISTLLGLMTVVLHYEGLRAISLMHLPKPKEYAKNARQKILFVVFGAGVLHVVEIWLFAAAYYVTERWLGWGKLGFDSVVNAPDTAGYHYLYYSSVVYTSLGFGDLVPQGALQMISSAETLVGLMMITWSASFTFLAMQKVWRFN